MLLGPILARVGEANIPKPGGDKIGRRRLDTHFIGFQNLGAKFNYDSNETFYSVEASNLKGTYVLLDEPSVTGTANIVMTAVPWISLSCTELLPEPKVWMVCFIPLNNRR